MPYPLHGKKIARALLVAAALTMLASPASASRCTEYLGPQPAPTPAQYAVLVQAWELERTDPRRAIALYKESIKSLKNGHAAFRLADIYNKGIPGVPRDFAESLQWGEVAWKLGVTYWSCS